MLKKVILTAALFFALAIGYVPRLVERGQVGRGLAVVSAGATAGFVLGVPLSTALGSAGCSGALAIAAPLTPSATTEASPALGAAGSAVDPALAPAASRRFPLRPPRAFPA